MLYLANLRNELNMLSINRLTPSTISPKDLKQVLLNVKEQIPKTTKLPANPRTNIWYFYHTLNCDVYLDGNKS